MPEIKTSWKSDQRFADASHKNISLIFFAMIVGLVAGLMGSLFRIILDKLEVLRLYLLSTANKTDVTTWGLPVLFSVVGVVIAILLVRRYAPETAGSGVQEIEGALDEVRPLRWKRVIPIKFIASLFSLGSGLLLGREGPTIQLGANIGKMVKDVFKLREDHSNPLISSGAAAGLACAFNAPFSGVIFVLEEMHGHFKFNFYSVAAIMVASATADIVVRLMTGVDPVIRMMVFGHQALNTLWLFVILGLVFSLVGYAFNKLLVLALNWDAHASKRVPMMLAIVIGLLIALAGIFYPEITGGGYLTIGEALENSFTLKFILFIFIARFFLTIFSYGSGVPGGIFAPMLALGVLLGLLFGHVAQHFFPELISNPAVFAVAGMAGIFASTVRAPLTGLALAIEMTANYELILPLLITTAVASVITAQMGNEPIYTTLLKRTMMQSSNS